MRKKKGFTLVELMVVIAILTILTSFAYPYLLDYIENGKYGAAQSETSAIANDIVRYKFCVGEYPATLQELENDNGVYVGVAKIPDEDPWGNAYFYQFEATKRFAVWSGGGNKANDSGSGYDGMKGDDIGVVAN